jgi:Bacterial pre-peptidase C-terminal domain
MFIDRVLSHKSRLIVAFSLIASSVWAFEERPEEPPKGSQIAIRQPQLNALFPMGIQPGQKLRLEIQGEFLDGVTQLLFESGDVSGSVVSATFTQALVDVAVSPDALPGPRRFRLASERGVSNTLLFRVSRWPTPVEAEPNNDLDSPMPVAAPALISGRLQTDQDVDLYRFHAKAGERLQFNVLGARNGSGADVSLAILYPDGREVAHDEGRFIWDPYLDHTFEATGDYLAAINLTRMPAGGQSRSDLNYQVAIGQSPFFWSVFPMGARQGTSSELALRGDFLQVGAPVRFSAAGLPPVTRGIEGILDERSSSGDYRLAVKISSTTEPGAYDFGVSDDSGTLAPLKFVVGDLPEATEAEPNDTMTQSQLLNAPLTVNGRMDRDGDQDLFRISAEAGASMLFQVDAEKYGSVLDSSLALLAADGKVLASNDDAKWPGRALNRDALLSFRFKEKGAYFVRVSSLYRRGGPDHVYRLTVRLAAPDFMLSLGTDRPSVQRGEKGKLGISLARFNEFKGEVRVEVTGLPAGVTAKTLVIPGDQEAGSIELEAAPGTGQTVSEIRVWGEAKVDGRSVRRRALLPPGRFQGSGPVFPDSSPLQALLAVVDPAQFSLESAASTVYLVRGGTAEFGVKVARKAGFAAPLRVTAENLPPGVAIREVDMIDEGRMARITLTASADAVSARVPNLTIIGTAEVAGRKTSVAAPRVSLQLD